MSNYLGCVQNLGKKSEKSTWDGSYLKLFGKGDAAYHFLRSYSCLCSPSCTDEEWKTL